MWSELNLVLDLPDDILQFFRILKPLEIVIFRSLYLNWCYNRQLLAGIRTGLDGNGYQVFQGLVISEGIGIVCWLIFLRFRSRPGVLAEVVLLHLQQPLDALLVSRLLNSELFWQKSLFLLNFREIILPLQLFLKLSVYIIDILNGLHHRGQHKRVTWAVAQAFAGGYDVVVLNKLLLHFVHFIVSFAAGLRIHRLLNHFS